MHQTSQAHRFASLVLLVGLIVGLFPTQPVLASPQAPSSRAATFPAPAAPNALIEPFADPLRAALEAALGPDADPLFEGAAATRLELLDSPAQQRPSVMRPTAPNPLLAIAPAAPQPTTLQSLAAQPGPQPEPVSDEPDTASAETDGDNSAAPSQSLSLAAAPFGPPPSPPVNANPAQAQPQAQAATATNRLYLPLLQTAGTVPERLVVEPTSAGVLRSSDGRLELQVPAGAVLSTTTITYRALPAQPVAGFVPADVFFELTAQNAQGRPVTQFQRDLTLRVRYAELSSAAETRLRLHFYDETHHRWVPMLSTVDRSANLLVTTTNHFTRFAPLATLTASCAEVPLTGLPADIKTLFQQACQRVGGIAITGEPVGVPFILESLWVQEFINGAIISSPTPLGAIFMSEPLATTYLDASSTMLDWAGAPVADTIASAPEAYRDEIHDFRNQPYSALERGFVGVNSRTGNSELHLNYPTISQIVRQVAIVDDPVEVDDQGRPVKKARLSIAATVDPAPAVESIAGRVDLAVTFDDGSSWTPYQIATAGDISFTYDQLLPLTRTLTLHASISRGILLPSIDLIGYGPCLYYEHLGEYGPVSVVGPDVTWTVGCQGAGGPGGGDFLPPNIRFVEVWPDGQGNLSIKVEITDAGSGVASASITGGPGTLSPALIPTPEFGPNIYSAVFRGVQQSQIVNFTVTASDVAGNTASATGNSRVTFRGRNGLSCANPCSGYEIAIGNPVLPGLGNKVEPLPITSIAGPGEADINLAITYNAQDPTVGLTGQGWSFPYQASVTRRENLLLTGYEVIYPDGRQVLFAENNDGTISPITPDVHDRLELRGGAVVVITKQLTEYEFDAAGRLAVQRDRNGNAIRFTYSGEQLTRLENDAGRAVTLTYNGQGLITEINAPEGKRYTFSYDGTRLVGFTDGRNNPYVFTYQERYLGTLLDVDGQLYDAFDAYLSSVRTPKGHLKNKQQYDDRGRVTEQWIGGRQHRTFIYDDVARTTTVTDAFNHVTVYHYDALYRLVRIDYADGTFELFEYDADFNRTLHQNQNGHVYTYKYDDRGNRKTEDGPLGWHREWDYNQLDQVTRFEDAEGREIVYEYDQRGNLKKIINALDDTSSITYDGRGLPIEVRDFNDNLTNNSYDPVTGDLVTTVNGEGDTRRFTYDDLGRLRTLTNGRGFTTTYGYDGNDNLLLVAAPLNYTLSYSYDKNDNLETATDANGGVSRYEYDESENLIEGYDQFDFPNFYGYDAMNNLTRVEDAERRVWTFDYDAVYNRIAEHGPEDTHTLYAYDSGRRVTDITRCNSAFVNGACAARQVQHFDYDALDRVTSDIANYVVGAPVSADTNVTTAYEYDLVGNLLRLVDANNNATTYAYDDLDRLTREETAAGQVTSYVYDDMGNLIELVNPRTFATSFTYDRANRLATSTDAFQQTIRYSYDRNGNLVTQTDPLNIVTRYAYDALDRLDALTLNERPGEPATSARNVTTRFRYDRHGNLRFVDDPRGGYVTEHRYDAVHRRVLTIDAEGGETAYAYDKVDNRTAATDANGHTTRFAFDGLDRQTRVTNAEGHSVSFVYDRLGNLLTLTDARGNPSRYRYDGLNRVIGYTDNEGGIWSYLYDPVGVLLAQTDANGHTDRFTYDVVYRMLSRTDAEGHVTSWSYDPNNNPLTRTDGNGHVTSSTYDKLDRLATRTNAENETTGYAYNWQGNQTALTEADGVVTAYTYDPLYRLSAVTQNSRPGQPATLDVNVVTRYSYDAAGNLVEIRDANSNPTSFSFDGLNRLTREVDAIGGQWDYRYDKTFNRVERVDALRNRTLYTYYDDDQLRRIAYHDGSFVAYSYDENNNPLTIANELGTTTRSYDKLNRLISEQDAFARPKQFTYDAVGNRLTITYPDGRIVTSAYYDNDWLKSTTDPEDRVTTYTRDGVGNVTRQVNPNNTVVTQSFDKADRLLALENRQVGGANTINSRFVYTYDDVGQRVTMEATYAWRQPAVETSSYTYDTLRRLVRDEDSQGRWTEYSFDAVGNRLTLRTNDDSLTNRPFDAKTLVYSYNAVNQLLSVVGDTHPGSPGLKRTDNAAQAIHAFRHEVAAQQNKGIGGVAAANLLNRADALLGTLYGTPAPRTADVQAAVAELRAAVEGYQAQGVFRNTGIATSLLAKLRLADEANSGASGELQTVTYRYDANGNRVNKEFPGPQGPRVQGTDYRYDPENRLVVAQDYQQSLQGNRVDRAVTTMDHDGEGRRLLKVYDPKSGGGGAKRVEYVYDGLLPIAEYNIWNPQHENFYRGDMGRILELHHFPSGTQGQAYWYHYDGLGSVAGLTKQSGQSSHNYRYESYGQIELPNGNFTDPHNHYTFTGQEWDERTALYDFFARQYDPDTGTWLTQDSYRGQIAEPRSLHRFQYVYNGPINYYDPYGYWPEFLDNAVKTVTSTVSNATNTVSSAVESAGNWIDENKDTIVKTAVAVAAVGAMAGLCAATVGVGCLVAAGAGAALAGSGTAIYNVSTGRDWHENVLENTLLGAAVGVGVGAAVGIAPAAIAWGSSIGVGTQAMATAFGASAGLASFAGTVASIALPSGVVVGTGLLYGGLPCALNPLLSGEAQQYCLMAATAGLSLSSGSFYAGTQIGFCNQSATAYANSSPNPKSPMGHRGKVLEVRPGTNAPTQINGRMYTGHALDQMQGRGIVPSVVENAIKTGNVSAGNQPGTFVYSDTINRIRVVTNTNGDIVTVIHAE